ncbi:MAG: IS66 family insertion sequence element accessory protein TnpB [Flavobacteriales bacterium]|nr:IS66 family insertion sequence element accessory protein TnpB [Flavobacteriales bacterium]
MLALTSAHHYLLRKSPTDMRKGFDSLCGLVRDELGRDPLSGEVFVFIGSRRDRIKLLLYESGGYVLWYKRLERGTLELPKGDGAVKLSWGCKLPQDQVCGIVEPQNQPELWDNEKEQMDGSADRGDAARA